MLAVKELKQHGQHNWEPKADNTPPSGKLQQALLLLVLIKELKQGEKGWSFLRLLLPALQHLFVHCVWRARCLGHAIPTVNPLQSFTVGQTWQGAKQARSIMRMQGR